VLPCPTIVMGLPTMSPVGPYSVCVLPGGSTIVSAPLPAGHPPVAVSVLAAVMASTSVQESLTVIVAADTGDCPRASTRAKLTNGPRHCLCNRRRTQRGKARN